MKLLCDVLFDGAAVGSTDGFKTDDEDGVAEDVAIFVDGSASLEAYDGAWVFPELFAEITTDTKVFE